MMLIPKNKPCWWRSGTIYCCPERFSLSLILYPSLFYKALHKATATQNYPLEEFNDYLRSFPESIDQISQTLAYFEPMNFASRVKSEVMLMEESEGDANDLAVSFAREIERSGSKHSSYKDGVVLAEWLSKNCRREKLWFQCIGDNRQQNN